MKKTISFLAALLCVFQSYATLLETSAPGGGWQNVTLNEEIRPCDMSLYKNLKVTMTHELEHYDRYLANWWDIQCRILDVTTSSYQVVETYSLNVSTSPGVANNLLLTAMNDNRIIFDMWDQQLGFVFYNVNLKSGHRYEAEVKLVFGGVHALPYPSHTEWSNRLTVNGYTTMTPNQWNHSIVQPSYTKVSDGLIAGNPDHEGYLISNDNMVYNVVYSNNQWNIWALSNTFTNAAPGAITVNPNNGEVYFIGTDGRIYNCVWANNQWNIWALSNTFTNAAPGAIAVNPNNGEVYFIGTDGRIYNCVWANNQWNIWAVSNTFTNAAPGAISVNPNNGEVYFIGTDGRIYNCVWANNQWNIWAVSNTFTNAAPGAISVNPNNGQVYFIGTDGRVYNCVWTNNQWNVWALDNNYVDAEPGAIVVQPASGHVYFINQYGHLQNAVWSSNQWNIWAVDNNNTVSKGTLGAHTKWVGSNLYDIVHVKNEESQLIQYTWLSCSEGKAAPGDDLANNSPAVNMTNMEPIAGGSAFSTDVVSVTRTKPRMRISPNPVDNIATINCTLSTMSDINVALFDITGKKIRDIYAGNTNAGEYQFRFQKDNLQAGMYYLIMQINNQEKIVEKVIVK